MVERLLIGRLSSEAQSLVDFVVATRRDQGVWPTWQFVRERLYRKLALNAEECLRAVPVHDRRYAAVKLLDRGGGRDEQPLVATILGLYLAEGDWARRWAQSALEVIRAMAREKAATPVRPDAVVTRSVKLSTLLAAAGVADGRQARELVSSVLREEPSVWHSFNGVAPDGDWDVLVTSPDLQRYDVATLPAYFDALAGMFAEAAGMRPVSGFAVTYPATVPDPLEPPSQGPPSSEPADRRGGGVRWRSLGSWREPLRRVWRWCNDNQLVATILGSLAVIGIIALCARLA